MRLFDRSPSVALAALILLSACGGGTQGQPAATAEPPKDELTMAFVPSAQAQQVLTNAQPIADFVSREVGVKVKVQVPTSYAAVVEGLTSKNVDVAWVGALAYVAAHERSGAEPMTKSQRCPPPSLVPNQPSPCAPINTYPSIIIVRKEAGINTVADLKGKKFAFGDPDSTSSNLWPRFYLKQSGIDPDRDFARAVNISSQGAIALAVYNGTVDAGAMFGDARLTARRQAPDILDKTKVLFTAPQEIPGDPQIVRKGLNPDQKEKLRRAFIKMGTDASMKKALKDIYSIDALEPAKDSDYDPVRRVVQSVNPGVLGTFTATPSPSVSPTASPSKSP